MIRVTGVLHKFTFDHGKWTKKLDEQAEALVKGAAREWVRAVIFKVPVWSGHARGSVKYAKGRSGPGTGMFLYQFLHVAVPINPVENSWRSSRNPEAGGRQARWTLSAHRHRYVFTYNNSVLHYLLNEFYGGSPPSFSRPWHSFNEGKAAFNNHIRGNKERLYPKVSDFLVTSKVHIG